MLYFCGFRSSFSSVLNKDLCYEFLFELPQQENVRETFLVYHDYNQVCTQTAFKLLITGEALYKATFIMFYSILRISRKEWYNFIIESVYKEIIYYMYECRGS